jgi:hypothetical protein
MNDVVGDVRDHNRHAAKAPDYQICINVHLSILVKRRLPMRPPLSLLWEFQSQRASVGSWRSLLISSVDWPSQRGLFVRTDRGLTR